MAKLIYALSTSLDGYINDESGNFDFTQPDEEVHRFFNELESQTGTHLLGRRMWETLRYWDDPPQETLREPVTKEFADAWRKADKLVYSRSLESATAPRTRLEHEFDPSAVRRLKDEAEADLGIGGATLAAEALRAGLVDELFQVIQPFVVGAGTHWLPTGLRLELELLDERRFDSGAVHLHYRVRN
jgi:dihydrofolate reductase